MKSFIWGVIREALLSRSEEVLAAAADFLAKYVPLTAEAIKTFLEACLRVVIQLGDEWIGVLLSAADKFVPFAACGDEGCCGPVGDCPPEIAGFASEFQVLASVS